MNMVTLKIVGSQTSLDGEENVIEMMTEGKYYEKNGSMFLVYDESELSGMEGSTTTLKIDDKENRQVMMKRFGNNQSKLIFEKGIRHKTLYQTLYGAMDMEVLTSQIILVKDEEKSLKKLDLSYKLCVAGDTELKNKLTIDII